MQRQRIRGRRHKSFITGLVDYIHLNSAQVGICEFKALKDYKLSSYPKFFLKDSPRGALDPFLREKLTKQYCRGWFIGPKAEKKALEKDLNKKYAQMDWEGAALKELKHAQWVCSRSYAAQATEESSKGYR